MASFEMSSRQPVRRSERIAIREAAAAASAPPTQALIERSKARARSWLDSGFEPVERLPVPVNEPEDSSSGSQRDDGHDNKSDCDLSDFVSSDRESEFDEQAAAIMLLQARRNRIVMSGDRELVTAAVKHRLLRDFVACMPPGSSLADFPSREDRNDLVEMDGRLKFRAHIMAESSVPHSWPANIMRLLRRYPNISNEKLALGAKCQLCGNKEQDGDAHALTLSSAEGNTETLIAGAGCLKRAYICHLYINFSETIRKETAIFLSNLRGQADSVGKCYELAVELASVSGSLVDKVYALWKNLRKTDDTVVRQGELVRIWMHGRQEDPRFEE